MTLDAAKPGSRTLKPEVIGAYGFLSLGATTFGTLKRFLDLDLTAADAFVPEHWAKPANLGSAKPDALIVQGRSVVGVVEHKAAGELADSSSRRAGLEQLHTYLLVCRAQVGGLTDGTSTLWVHNCDPLRVNEVKQIKENGLLCTRDFEPTLTTFHDVLMKLNHITDELSTPPRI